MDVATKKRNVLYILSKLCVLKRLEKTAIKTADNMGKELQLVIPSMIHSFSNQDNTDGRKLREAEGESHHKH